jgi:2-keto-4-pentenoate hydratase
MSMDARLERLAADLAEAWRRNATIPLPDGGSGPASRAEAFAVQDRMVELVGDRTAGWKVGAAVEAVQQLEGHDGPIVGRILTARVHHSPATVPAATFAEGKVECEFAFRLTADLPLREAPYTRDDLAGIMVFHPAIELTGSRYAATGDGRQPSTHEVIADNCSASGFVFGPPLPAWHSLPFATLPIDARLNGTPLGVYTGVQRYDPVTAVADTAIDLARRGIGLKAGDYVSTGSATVPIPVSAGQTLVAVFGDLSRLEVTLV